MKRIVCAVLSFIVVASFCGCGGAASSQSVINLPDHTGSSGANLSVPGRDTPVPDETMSEPDADTPEPDAAVSEPDADSPDEVWGDLEESEGGLVFDTLTGEQQDMVNYPKLDENKVYWTPGGKSYHSVDWCYTLSRSKEVFSGTIEEAIRNGKADPCSKCVGD
jgi:hypothetical protein